MTTRRLTAGCLVTALLVGVVTTTAEARKSQEVELPAYGGSLGVQAERISRLETPAQLGPDASVVFIGDSLGGDIAKGLEPEAARRGASVVRYTVPGCSNIEGLPMLADGTVIPWAPGCLDHLLRTWRNQVASTPASAVLWLSSFDGSTRLVGNVVADPSTERGRQMIADLIIQTADIVAPPGTGRRVVFFLPSPSAPSAEHGDPDPQSTIDLERHRAILHLVVAHDPSRFSMLPLDRFLCPAGPPCPAEPVPGIAPRGKDGGHVTPQGAAWLAPQILDALGVT